MAISVKTICLCTFEEAGKCLHNFLEVRLQGLIHLLNDDIINSNGIGPERTGTERWQSFSGFLHFYLDWLTDCIREQSSRSTICKDFGCTHTTFAPCTPIISIFPFPPRLRVKIVDLSCCSWRISTRPCGSLRELSNSHSEAQLPLHVTVFPPFAFMHLFFWLVSERNPYVSVKRSKGVCAIFSHWINHMWKHVF